MRLLWHTSAFPPSKCPFASHLAISLSQWNLLLAIKIYRLFLLLVYSKFFFMCFPNKKRCQAFDLPCTRGGEDGEGEETVQDSTLKSLLCGKYVTVRKKGLNSYLKKLIVVPLTYWFCLCYHCFPDVLLKQLDSFNWFEKSIPCVSKFVKYSSGKRIYSLIFYSTKYWSWGDRKNCNVKRKPLDICFYPIQSGCSPMHYPAKWSGGFQSEVLSKMHFPLP